MFDYSILYTLRRGEQNKCGFILEFVALPKKLTLHYVLAEVTIHFVPRSFRHMTFLSHTTIEGEDESTVKMHGGECVWRFGTSCLRQNVMARSDHETRRYEAMVSLLSNQTTIVKIAVHKTILRRIFKSNNPIKHVDVYRTRERKIGDIPSSNNLKKTDKRTFSVHSFDYHPHLSELFSPFTPCLTEHKGREQ